MSKTNNDRKENPNLEWDLSYFFKSDSDPKIKFKRSIWESQSYKFINNWKKRTDYLTDVNVLKKAIEEYEDWLTNYGVLADEMYYYWLKFQKDQNDPKIKAGYNNVHDFSKKIENDISFFVLNLSKIPLVKQKEFLNDPKLSLFNHFLERIFKQSKYFLSENEEKILNLKSTSSYSNWINMVSGLLSKEEREVIDEDHKKVKKSYVELLALMKSQNKTVRDSAAIAFNDIMKKYTEIAEAEINSILQDKKINDELRGFIRPDSARHLDDDVSSEIVDMMIEVISKNYEISRKFYSLKAKLFGLKKLEFHERNVPYGKIAKEYDFNESIVLIKKVFNNLDPDFSKILEDFIKNSQIDVYPNKGKRGGAFCVYFLKTQPTFILLNHTNKLNDVLTLAHELGHGCNNEFMKTKQSALYFSTPIFTAEVASTFMEDFVFQELMKNVNEEEKLSLMVQKLEDDISTIIRQVACYKFETDLHKEFREKGYLSYEDIGKLYQKQMSNYMGPSVNQSNGSENWWVYWSHIREFFYTYSYASGSLISKAMQKKFKDDPKFIIKVKEFLSAGSSKSPVEIFKDLGIDVTKKDFFIEGIKEVKELLEETEKLAKKLKKI